MKKIIKFTAFLSVLALIAVGVANASMIIPSADQAKEKSQAPAKSPVIEETPEGEWDLERVDFIHYAKPDGVGNGGKPKGGDACYKLMGVKWREAPVSYIINPSNSQGLSESFITSTVQTSMETWDNATSLELVDNNYAVDYGAQYGVQNYQNAIAFGNYPDSGVIGVTSVWYTRVGKKIVEFDMLLNTDFAWGDATIDSAKMDLENIVTHEAGHAVGLSDIYSGSCANVTMYGYSTEGETSKRDLEAADISGLQAMYGI